MPEQHSIKNVAWVLSSNEGDCVAQITPVIQRDASVPHAHSVRGCSG